MFSSFYEQLASRTIIALLSPYTNNNIAKLIEQYYWENGMKGLRYTN